MKNRGEIENDSLIRFDFLIFPRGLGANAFGLVYYMNRVKHKRYVLVLFGASKAVCFRAL